MVEDLPPFDVKLITQQLFNNTRLRPLMLKSFVWAARDHRCPKCNADPYERCVNMSDVNKALAKAKLTGTEVRASVRPTKWPHDERIDWQKLYDALIERGYGE